MRTARDAPSSAMLKLIRRYANSLPAQVGRLALAGVRPALAALLARTGITAQLGDSAVVPTEPALLAPLDRAAEEARQWIATR
ncbi:hypothetical protein ACFZCK_17735 [Kitasatospora purpeofusca]|uniref:hypothetical protein n=1 Tax=Kitasatospora purpeofusca TaxID=67352 RepID=UPI0036E69C55